MNPDELRDFFAGCALAGMLSNEPDDAEYWSGRESVASWAYDYADAMLAERDRRQQQEEQ